VGETLKKFQEGDASRREEERVQDLAMNFIEIFGGGKRDHSAQVEHSQNVDLGEGGAGGPPRLRS